MFLDIFTRFSTFRSRSLSFTLPVMLIMLTSVSYTFVLLLRKQLYRKPTFLCCTIKARCIIRNTSIKLHTRTSLLFLLLINADIFPPKLPKTP